MGQLGQEHCGTVLIVLRRRKYGGEAELRSEPVEQTGPGIVLAVQAASEAHARSNKPGCPKEDKVRSQERGGSRPPWCPS